MTDEQLSPAAQAVLHSFWDAPVSPARNYQIAAALRAAAEEVVLPKYQYANWEMAHLIMQEIQAIAADLEVK